MDVIEREDVKIENAVIISGLTLTETDEVVESYLLRFGSIRQNFLIDDPQSVFHHNAVVEFSHNSAICNIEPQLPLTIVSPTDMSVIFRIHKLSTAYSTATSSDTAKQLKSLEDKNVESRQDIIKQNSMKMNGVTHLDDASHREDCGLENLKSSTKVLTSVTNTPQRTGSFKPSALKIDNNNPAKVNMSTTSPHSLTEANSVSVRIPISSMHPPDIQRVIMEHVVKISETVPQHSASFCLKAFSGRMPRPGNEPDFDTWRTSVDYLLNELSLSESHKMQKILDSLLPPASDVIKHVSPNAPASECLRLLESVYGSVEDGDELLAKFINTLQDPGEKSSAYLHRLYVLLCTTIRRGGIAESERDRYLLKQFCRGCWDNALIVELQLERIKADPLSFAELAVLLRTAEEKKTSKEERMRKHLGLGRPSPTTLKLRTITHQQSAHFNNSLEVDATNIPAFDNPKQKVSKQKSKTQCPETSEADALKKEIMALQSQITAIKTSADQEVRERTEASELQQLKGQIAELKVQLATSGAQRKQFEKSPQQSNNPSDFGVSRERNGRQKTTELKTNRPRPWYCFRCGDDGHLAIYCKNAPNPFRVEEKRQNLREKQAEWDLRNGGATVPLN